jgi:hypothetical protein
MVSLAEIKRQEAFGETISTAGRAVQPLGNLLGKIFHTLGAPQRGVSTSLNMLQEGKFDPERLGSAIMSGKGNQGMGEFIGKAFPQMDMNSFGGKLAGFLGDVATDPTVLIPGALPLKLGTRSMNVIGKGLRLAEGKSPLVKSTVDTIGELFNRNYRLKKYEPEVAEIMERFIKGEGKALNELESTMNKFKDILDPKDRERISFLLDANALYRDPMTAVGRLRGTGKRAKAGEMNTIHPDFKKSMDEEATWAMQEAEYPEVVDFMKKIREQHVQYGGEDVFGSGYLHRVPRSITRPDLLKDIKNTVFGANASDLAKAGNTSMSKYRKTRELSLDKVLTPGGDLKFETDFPTIAGMMSYAMTRKGQADKAIDQITKLKGFLKQGDSFVGNGVTIGKEGADTLEKLNLGKGMSKYNDYYVPKDIAMVVNSYFGGNKPKGATDVVLQGLKHLNTGFKRMALYSPNYIKLNIMGNLANPILAGAHKPMTFVQDYIDGLKIVLGKGEINVGSKSVPATSLRAGMREEGALSGGMNAVEMARNEMGDIIGSPTNPIQESVRAIPNTNKFFEDLSRSAVFMGQYRKTKDFKQASDMVNKTLFNYGDLSPFEEKLRAYFIPFYAFARKNIPFHLKNLADNPQGYSVLNQLFKNIAYKGPENKLQSDIFKEPSSVPLRKDPKTGEIVGMPLTALPFEQLNLLNPKTSARSWLSMIYPHYTLPLQLLTGKNFYTGGQISKYPGEKTRYDMGPLGKYDVPKEIDLILRAFNRPFREASGTMTEMRNSPINPIKDMGSLKYWMGERRYDPAQELKSKTSAPTRKILSLAKTYIMKAAKQDAIGDHEQAKYSREQVKMMIKSLMTDYYKRIKELQ